MGVEISAYYIPFFFYWFSHWNNHTIRENLNIFWVRFSSSYTFGAATVEMINVSLFMLTLFMYIKLKLTGVYYEHAQISS